MNRQPEALRLADWFESFYLTTSMQAKAAAELRRLQAENEALRDALQGLLDVTDFHELYGSKTEAARAIIHKSTGGTPCQ